MNQNVITSMNELRTIMSTCMRCQLHDTRHTVVFGEGPDDADAMIVGEAPGANEDLQGKPFVGAAGKNLDNLLEQAGIDRSRVFVTNILKCRPPQNRDPQPDEEIACTPYLDAQIALMQPKVIITLGNYSTKYLLHTDIGITRLHGKVCQIGNRIIVPTFHPAAAIYDKSKQAPLIEDLKRAKAVIDSVRNGTFRYADPNQTPTPSA